MICSDALQFWLPLQAKVWGVQSAETGELVLYPREHPPLIKVSADVAALWHEVAVSDALLNLQIQQQIQPILVQDIL